MQTVLRAAVAACLAISATPIALGHGNQPHADAQYRPANLDPVDTRFGRTGDPKKVTRTIRIAGDDAMRFTPSLITVRQGETIRFVVQNKGKVMHEAVLGTLDELQKHAEAMRRYPKMEHDEPFMVHVGPGESGEMIWHFTESGEFHFGCLIPGHFEAGMRGVIKVVAR